MTSPDAMRIVREFQKKPPVDVGKLANRLGARVYVFGRWPDHISGKVYRNNKDGGTAGYVIGVNKNHSSTRKRFTIAHEIAHIILHDAFIGKNEKGIVDDRLYRSNLSNPLETAANRMAADILMPLHLLQEAIDQNGPNVDELAAQFKVSPAAMTIRLGLVQD